VRRTENYQLYTKCVLTFYWRDW